MAVNKNSTSYTVTFAVVLVTICGSLLAFLATSLKPLQKANVANEKRQFILSAAGFASMDSLKTMEMSEVKQLFEEKIESSVFNFDGTVADGKNAFTIDIVKEFKATKSAPKERAYPVFTYKGDKKKYIIPMAGNGLWGPVWGYIALDEDQNTIVGAIFDHKSETPGLGAKITESFFQEMFKGKQIMKDQKYMGIKVVKGGVKEPNHQVDAIAGATITSNGVSAMTKPAFKPYMKAWGKIK